MAWWTNPNPAEGRQAGRVTAVGRAGGEAGGEVGTFCSLLGDCWCCCSRGRRWRCCLCWWWSRQRAGMFSKTGMLWSEGPTCTRAFQDTPFALMAYVGNINMALNVCITAAKTYMPGGERRGICPRNTNAWAPTLRVCSIYARAARPYPPSHPLHPSEIK